MSRELKVGILTFIAILGIVWGYMFVKGQNLFSRSLTLQTTFEDVSKLAVSAPVYIRGLNVGSVSDIDINEEDLTQMIVELQIEGEYKIPKDAKVYMISEGLVGGNALAIKYDVVCNGTNCASDGDFLESRTESILASFIGDGDLENVTESLGSTLGGLLDSLGNPDSDRAIDATFHNLNRSMENIAKLTASTNQLIVNSSSNINKSLSNLSLLTNTLANNNQQITAILNNLAITTEQLKNTNVKGLVDNSNQTILSSQKMIEDLQKTATLANQTFADINAIVGEIQSGEGSLSQLINDKKLYKNLEMTSKNMSLLLQDLRLNPKRYVSVSVFGGKNNDEYVKPENDPAFQSDK